VVDIDKIKLKLARVIQDVGPFGETNPEPVFMMEKARIREMMTMTNGKHLKLYVQKGNQIFECVWWNAGEYKDILKFGQLVDVAFRLNINNWQGTERLQLTLEDMRTVAE